MRKGYIKDWNPDVPPNENREMLGFCELASDAAVWSSKESAEVDCSDFQRGVAIPYGSGHVYTDFHIEKDGDGFVIYCEAEF